MLQTSIEKFSVNVTPSSTDAALCSKRMEHHLKLLCNFGRKVSGKNDERFGWIGSYAYKGHYSKL